MIVKIKNWRFKEIKKIDPNTKFAVWGIIFFILGVIVNGIYNPTF